MISAVDVWMLTVLMGTAAQAEQPSPAMLRRAHRAAQQADCSLALSLSALNTAPESRRRDRAATAQVRCAASTLLPTDPVHFYDAPLANAALVEPGLQRELTTAVALSGRAVLERSGASLAQAAALHEIFVRAQALDNDNWMLWEASLLSVLHQLDGPLLVSETQRLMALWSNRADPGGAHVLAAHCSALHPQEGTWTAPLEGAMATVADCHALLERTVREHPGNTDLIGGLLVVSEAVAWSPDGSLRAQGRAALRQWAPGSVLVVLLDAEERRDQGDHNGAVDAYLQVVSAMPDLLVARLEVGMLLGEDALSRFDGTPPEDASSQARSAMEHLEVAFAHEACATEDRVRIARLMVQLSDRLQDSAAEQRWRREYSATVLGR